MRILTRVVLVGAVMFVAGTAVKVTGISDAQWYSKFVAVIAAFAAGVWAHHLATRFDERKHIRHMEHPADER